jgi:hypothetical protein
LAADLSSAIDLAATGSFGQAEALCDDLAQDDVAAGYVLRASMWRQLGDANRAREFDERGSKEARDDETRVDAWIGCAADSLAINDLSSALHILQQVPEPAMWKRVHIRWLWVHSECALAAHERDLATQYADQAIDVSRAFGSERHVTKSQLIGAVARESHDEAVVCLHRSADAQWRYLAWAAATFLAGQGDMRWLGWAGDLAEAIDERLHSAQRAVWRANPAVAATRARVALGHV